MSLPFMKKRIFDLVLCSLLVIALSPLIVLISLLVWWFLGSPILFKQVRPGLHGNSFTMYKFRTMTNETDHDGNLLPNEVRLTRFGSLLRRTSIDELPGLLNVLKGDMSLVGPRPLLTMYLDRYTPEQQRRHDVLPGITGWAQIHGRNAISWEEKFALDVWYVDNWSVWLDMKILVLTAIKVLKREGVAAPGEFSAPEFMGQSTSGSNRTETKPEKNKE
jgi:sugar transferase EpsL